MVDLRVPTASAVQAKINFQIRIVPAWHQRCWCVTGNFVMLSFRGQGSGKSLPVPCNCGTEIKAQGCAENFNSRWRPLCGRRCRWGRSQG